MRDDLLSPRDALAKRWGRPSCNVVVTEPPAYLEIEDAILISNPMTDAKVDGSKESKATVGIQSLDRSTSPDNRQASRQSSYISARSSSIWSMQSVLSAITTPSSSRRGSEIGFIKASNSSVQSLQPKLRNFPQEILVCVIQHLRNLHEGPRSTTCSTCFNRDAFNLALVNRSWDRAARSQLYRYIHIDGLDSPKRSFKHNSRLKLLRRTLRDRTALAKVVQELRIWNIQDVFDKQVQDQIASIIMACPNLQLFTGSQPFYSHNFSRIHHALATRRHLQSQLWVIGEVTALDQSTSSDLRGQFLNLHRNWDGMKTLALRCQRDAIFERGIFLSLTQLLPSLENLSISGFEEEVFNDESLLALKSLKALRLADLPGITDKGLATFSNTQQAASLQSLALSSLNISSLYTIARILSNLNITKFTFTHFRSLSIPAEDIVFQPLLASKTLERLHWEVPLLKSELHQSTLHLATSIKHAGFPSLRYLRCPIDTDDGALQALCKPQSLPESNTSSPQLSASQISGSTLRAARLRATARSLAGSRGEFRPGMKIKRTNADGSMECLLTANWLGYVACDRNIEYVLTSDLGPWEQRKVLVEEGDLLGDVTDAGGCQGKGKGKGARGHVERVRWRAAEVEMLF